MSLTLFFAALTILSTAAPNMPSDLSTPVPSPEHRICPTSAVLYYAPYCVHSRRVLEYIKEMNVQIPMKDVSQDEAAKEELRTKGGLMQVPCLFIDGKPLYDDELIMQWIKENRECLDLSVQKPSG